jgi:4-amino-4-deoxy-L-arabinose transferase-like glycosyltransferase
VRRLAYWLGLVALILLGIALRSAHMTDINTRSPDEYSYTAYAGKLADAGPAAFPEQFKIYNEDSRYWVHPSPARFGYVLLTSAVMRITGTRNARSGAAVSWFFSILSLPLLAWLGLRFFNKPVALLAVAFFSFSFSELAMARRAWQDATFGFLGLLLVCLTCAITAAPRRRSLHVAFFATGAYCLLIKETGWVSFGTCILWLAGVAYFQQRSWDLIKTLLIGGLASLAVIFGILTALAGGIEPVIAAQQHILKGTAESTYGIYYDGPWYQFFWLLWLVGPLTAIMALFGAVTAFGRRSAPSRDRLHIRDWRAAQMATVMAGTFILIASFGHQLQYLRLISPAEGAYCLLAGFGVWSLVGVARSFSPVAGQLAIPFLSFALLIEGVVDYRNFTEVIVNSGMEDLAVKGIRDVMGR